MLTINTRRSFQVREYRPGAESGSLLIERTTRTTLRGTASRGEDTTVVEGTGSGRMTIDVHSSTGAIISAEGTGSLDITVRARNKIERARQSLEARIARRVP
jgi:hypothetical protein